MKKMICEKGHFYDGDKYDSCPTCQMYQGHQTANTSTGSVNSNTGTGNKSSGNEAVETPKKETHQKKGWLAGLLRSNGGSHTVELPFDEIPGKEEQSLPPKGGTMVLSEEEVEKQEIIQETPQESYTPPVAPVMPQAQNTPPVVQTPPEAPYTPPVAQTPPEAPYTPQVLNSSSGKTVLFYGMEDEPVTGFLICMKGESRGTAYTLKTGQNFIGRGTNMDVVLDKEPSVSRYKHAIILFDPKKREFYIQPGESSGLTYLNGDLVMSFNRLSAYDVIQLGECMLVFLPFCGERFSWDEV